jgi:hypothetical protein
MPVRVVYIKNRIIMFTAERASIRGFRSDQRVRLIVATVSSRYSSRTTLDEKSIPSFAQASTRFA